MPDFSEKKYLYIIIFIVVVLVAAGSIYYFLIKEEPKDQERPEVKPPLTKEEIVEVKKGKLNSLIGQTESLTENEKNARVEKLKKFINEPLTDEEVRERVEKLKKFIQ